MTTITRERAELEHPDHDRSVASATSLTSESNRQTRRPRRSLVGKRSVHETAIVCMLAVVSVIGFGGALSGWAFLSSAALGVAGATLVFVLAERSELLLGEAVAASVLGLAVLGGPASGGLPLPGSYLSFADGLIHGWADLISSAPPADLTPSLRVLPYVVAWFSTSIGLMTARRASSPVAPLVGPVLGLVVTVLLTVEQRTIAVAQGAAFAIGAIALGLLATDSQRKLRAVSLMLVVAVIAPVLAPQLPYGSSSHRLDLRQFQDRPWDPLELPSPLVTLKASLKEGRSDDVVFTVTADEPITRWQFAVLGHYDGVVWTVADSARADLAQFRPVDSALPPPSDDIDTSDPVTVDIEIGELGSIWVPSPGWPTSAEQAGLDLRFNGDTGTVAAVGGLSEGQQIRLTAFRRPELTDYQFLTSTTVSNDDDAILDLVPPAVRNVAGDIFEGVDAGTSRAVALRQSFTQSGFYDHGRASRPGHSLARIDDFLSEPDRLVGYAETYAAAAGVIARVGGVPSRVVVGYVIPEDRYIDGEAKVVAQDITAWIEIQTVEHGWVPLDVTPDRTREPQNEQLGTTVNDVAVPNPPPPPPPPPEPQPSTRSAADQEDDEPDEEETTSNQDGSQLPRPVVVLGSALGLPTLLLGATGLLIAGLKRKRRRTRRSAQSAVGQVAGAWDELLDRCSEAGVSNDKMATASETVASIVGSGAVPDTSADDLESLARHMDRAIFHPAGVSEQSAADAWGCTDRTVAVLAVDRSRWERLCLQTDPRPLLRADRRFRPAKRASTRNIS